MKNKIIYLVALLFFSLSYSCVKPKVLTTTSSLIKSSIYGLWIGTYTMNAPTTNTDNYFSFMIKPDGKMIVESKFSKKQNIAIGSWTLKGKVFSCTYEYVYPSTGTTQNATATLDTLGKLNLGKWHNVIPQNGANGTFLLMKAN